MIGDKSNTDRQRYWDHRYDMSKLGYSAGDSQRIQTMQQILHYALPATTLRDYPPGRKEAKPLL